MRVGIGMQMTCKYHYRGGFCANSQMQSPFCAGEDSCTFLNKGAVEIKAEAKVQKGDELSQWLGVYCPHYQRFYCTGESEGCKTGCCATPEDYHMSMAANLERSK